MTTPNSSPSLRFRVRSRFGLVRDLAMIVLCAVLIGGFLTQVWHGPTPERDRAVQLQ
jgi:hypothetical protein